MQLNGKGYRLKGGLRWGYAVEFVVLFAFWVIFSGHFEWEYLLIGAGAAALATFVSRFLIFPQTGYRGGLESPLPRLIPLRFARYALRFLWEMIKANIQVAWIVLQPRLPVAPAMLRLHSNLSRPVSQVTLANSITLTPGTLTVEFEDGNYLIHTLTPESAESLVSARMQNGVARAFGEAEEKPPQVTWWRSLPEQTR